MKATRSHTSPVLTFDIRSVRDDSEERIVDSVATEEPLQIQISHFTAGTRASVDLAILMRTPGHDRELTAGFLLSEGIIQTWSDLEEIHHIGPVPSNEILASLADGVSFDDWTCRKRGTVGASCGICGKQSRDSVQSELPGPISNTLIVTPTLIEDLPERLQSQQAGFAQTGGLHAAALVSSTGDLEAIYEDIGRHNALDKLLGYKLLASEIPLRDSVILLSSRSSFELVQKAAMAGAQVLATVGGPSSLAIEAARDWGITLIGFVRGKRFNIYSGEWRVRR